MEKEIAVAIVGSFTTVLVAAGGWVFAWLLQRETKARERQRDLIENWQVELLARIALEDVSAEWIAELTGKPKRQVKIEARERAEKKSGARPRYSRSDVYREASGRQELYGAAKGRDETE